jgi:hypothetical protein
VTENSVTAGEDQNDHQAEGPAVGRESVASAEDNKTGVVGAPARKGGATGHGE